MIMVRQALRIIARERAKDGMNNSALGFISGLANLILNRADLRSWLTLPAGAQIMFAHLDAGKHVIDLRAGGLLQTQNLDIVAGQTLILHVVALDGRFHVNKIEL